MLVVWAVLVSQLFGQNLTNQGTPLFGTFSPQSSGVVNVGNLNVHHQIPIFSRAGRGISFSGVLNYDNTFWYPSNGRWAYSTNGSLTGMDWVGLAPAAAGFPAGYTITPAVYARDQFPTLNQILADLIETTPTVRLQRQHLDSTQDCS